MIIMSAAEGIPQSSPVTTTSSPAPEERISSPGHRAALEGGSAGSWRSPKAIARRRAPVPAGEPRRPPESRVSLTSGVWAVLFVCLV
jgi:hypothetical protein